MESHTFWQGQSRLLFCGKWTTLSLAKANANQFTRKLYWGSSSTLRVWPTHCSNCTPPKKKAKKNWGRPFSIFANIFFAYIIFSKNINILKVHHLVGWITHFLFFKILFFVTWKYKIVCWYSRKNCLVVCLLPAIFSRSYFRDHYCFKFILNRLQPKNNLPRKPLVFKE